MHYRRFGLVLRDLLIEQGITTQLGNANWMAFANTLDGVHYETLRKAATGERQPTAHLMESVGSALGVTPEETFVEYRLWKAQSDFDPREVGIDVALENLARWEQQQDEAD